MNNTQKTAPMNILIAGANGGIGKNAVTQALEAGHQVTALLRNPARLALTHPGLKIVQGDIYIPETFERYLENQDAVFSVLGNRTDVPTTLYSEGNRNLVHAMEKYGVRRAFFISAQAIEISPAQPFFVRLATRLIVQKLFGNGYADQRIMEQMIKESGIDWTIMRPPRLTNGPETGKYRVAINKYLKNCFTISRADVAHFMIHNITNPETYQAIVEMAY